MRPPGATSSRGTRNGGSLVLDVFEDVVHYHDVGTGFDRRVEHAAEVYHDTGWRLRRGDRVRGGVGLARLHEEPRVGSDAVEEPAPAPDVHESARRVAGRTQPAQRYGVLGGRVGVVLAKRVIVGCVCLINHR